MERRRRRPAARPARHRAGQVRVTLVNRDDWHSIRVRNYERDLADLRVPLAKVLEPIGVDRVVGDVTAIDVANRQVVCEAADGRRGAGL